MIYAIVFILAGICFIWKGFQIAGWGYGLVWIGFSLVVVGVAYGGVGPRVFGKSADGRMSVLAVVLLLPYLVGTWVVWHVRRWFFKEPAAQEVAPGIWLGRRPYLKELPPGIGLVVDLTAEFPAERVLRREIPYVCLPVLDAFVPSDAAFLDAVDRVLRETRPVYIHCAMGRGRSASVAAAVLIKKGLAGDVESAEALLRKVRGGVRLNRLQRRQVRRLMGPGLAPN